MSEPTPEFRACVNLAVTPDNVLHASACFGGYCFQRSFDLNPMIAYVHSSIVDYHRRLHGGDVMISGIGDFLSDAINAVNSVMSDKAVRKLWDDAGPVKDLIPGGAAVDIALKAHDQLLKARDGDKDATDKLQQLAGLALVSPAAAAVLGMTGTMNDMLDAKQSAPQSSRSSRSSSSSSFSRSPVVAPGEGFTVSHISGYRIGDVTVRDHRGEGRPQGGVVNAPGTNTPTTVYVTQPSPTPAPAPTPDPTQQANPYGYPPPGYGYPPPGGFPPPGYGMPDPYTMAMMQQQAMMQQMQQQAMLQQLYAQQAGQYGDPYSGYVPTAGGQPLDYGHVPGHVPGDDYASAQNPYGYKFSGWGYNRPYRDAGGFGSGLRKLYNTGLHN